jgi:hypothetical protein
LKVVKISSSGLKSVEMLGKNDPFVRLAFGRGWAVETKAVPNAGSAAEWRFGPGGDELKALEVTPKELEEGALSVTVLDHNDMLSHGLIGDWTGSLKSLLSLDVGKEGELDVQLKDKKGKASGNIKILFQMAEKVEV